MFTDGNPKIIKTKLNKVTDVDYVNLYIGKGMYFNTKNEKYTDSETNTHLKKYLDKDKKTRVYYILVFLFNNFIWFFPK